MNILLASQSPQRKHVLELLNLDFAVQSSQFDEYSVLQSQFIDNETYVAAVATAKVQSVLDELQSRGTDLSETILLGGDLMVFVYDNQVLHKPKTLDQALEYIQILEGLHHDEVCGHVIWTARDGMQCVVNTAQVTLPSLSVKERQQYIEQANPLQKAGGFSLTAFQKILKTRPEISTGDAIQIEGYMSTVYGFCIPVVASLLETAGVKILQDPARAEQQLHNEVMGV